MRRPDQSTGRALLILGLTMILLVWRSNPSRGRVRRTRRSDLITDHSFSAPFYDAAIQQRNSARTPRRRDPC